MLIFLFVEGTTTGKKLKTRWRQYVYQSVTTTILPITFEDEIEEVLVAEPAGTEKFTEETMVAYYMLRTKMQKVLRSVYISSFVETEAKQNKFYFGYLVDSFTLL